nr:hypothetical protein [Paracoccus versutus]
MTMAAILAEVKAACSQRGSARDLVGAGQDGGASFGRAAMDRVEQCQPPDQVGTLDRQARRDQRAYGVAGQIDRTQVQRLDQSRRPGDEIGQARSRRQQGRSAVPCRRQ